MAAKEFGFGTRLYCYWPFRGETWTSISFVQRLSSGQPSDSGTFPVQGCGFPVKDRSYTWNKRNGLSCGQFFLAALDSAVVGWIGGIWTQESQMVKVKEQRFVDPNLF